MSLLPSVSGLRPSLAQIDAFKAFKSGGKLFDNPLTGQFGNLTSSLSSPGGLNLSDVGDVRSKLLSMKNDTSLGLDAATKSQIDSIMTKFSSVGLDNVDIIKQNMDAASGALASQSNMIAGGMNIGGSAMDFTTITSAASGYKSIAQAFGPENMRVAPSTPGENPCPGISDLLGSLSGALDGAMNGIKDAAAAVAGAFNSISASVKNALNSALSSIKNAFSGFSLGGSGGWDTSKLQEIKDAISSFASGVTSFVSGVGSSIAAGIKSVVSAATAQIAEFASAIKDKITTELANIGKMFDDLKDAAKALSLPSLDPCAKAILSNVASAAGTSGGAAIMGLVS